MNLFKEVKEKITAKDVASYYGLKVGNNKTACCPFHDDHHPSMMIDRNYYCFSCGARGDAIDYVSRMFGLSPYDAALKINHDLGLGIDPKRKSSQYQGHRTNNFDRSKQREGLNQWRRESIQVLMRYQRWSNYWKEFYKPQSMEEEWHPLFLEALETKWEIEYYLDILLSGTEADIETLRKTRGKEMTAIGKRVREHEQRVKRKTGFRTERGA